MTEELWQKYLQTRDKEARDILIQEHLPLVKQVAGRLSLGLPPQVDEDDLIASGVIGLLEALERYNPTFEAGFKTFATWRIRGAMLDELRKLSWSPRSLYKRLRDLQETEQKLSHRLGREPSIAEVAAELQWSAEAVEQVYSQLNSYSLVSLESLLFPPSGHSGEQREDIIPADGGPFIGPEEKIEKQEWRDALARAIEELPEREKLVLALYYKEELTLKEIGRVLKVSTARVSQIHARTLRLLRDNLQKSGFLNS
ncbi:MAG: FliA/WhiG family RNA polymerase sigma factor [Firmicutes bacterium]|nr:FliA/WhiG family RNA polymerase sigma factor [Bacillota bacterium]